VIANWRYAGRGHSPGQAIYAATIAADFGGEPTTVEADRREEP
jgi:hypothetical protein